MSNLSHIGVDGYIGKEREFETFGPEDSGDGSDSPQPTVNAEEIIMADGTVEYVDKNAFGDELDRMPNGYYRSPQFIGTLAAQCLASTCAYLGWVLPSNTLALINADIGPSAQIAWVATIWTMGSSIGFLIIGRLSDLYGRKWMVMSTTLLGLIGCIIGGTAKSLGMLIASNGCNGLAAAGQLSFGIVLGELVPNKHRGPIMGFVFLTSIPFGVFGPVVARTMIENIHEGWRWSYYLGIILSVITLALYQFLYHPPTFSQLHVGKTRIQQTKELDWIGMSLFTTGCVLFLVGLSWGVTGIMTLAGFFVYEAYFCSVKPLIPSSVFKNTGFVAVVTCATVASMVYYSLTVLWPTIISALYTTDSIKVGWQSCVIGGGVVLGQAMSGLAIVYVPRLKIQCICAAALVMTFITSMCSLSPDRWANTIAFGLIACTAVGYIENVAVTCVTLLWEPQDIGLASGILGSIRALGGAIAQALYVSILRNELTRKMPEYVTPAATKLGLPTKSLPSLFEAINKGDYSDVPGINKAIIESVGDAVVKAYTNSLQYVFYATVPFSCIMLVAACLVPDVKKFLTYNVAKRLQDKSFRKSSTEANEVAVQAMNECHPDEAKVASHV
ncbi:Trichothecene efflux pump TRI12 [Fusarium oxysporum f. sp. raphani]|uniref:Trichothecene efflux pump TRI12 n=1 Tax=Fusarium oxysporum f. sp. raphani TaxID=96318 RepID=A0A8J5UDS2_FUSOX|nr:Trichothecene efflux pump TRI12 [Fusarium oxysporum f. sp. raphani]